MSLIGAVCMKHTREDTADPPQKNGILKFPGNSKVSELASGGPAFLGTAVNSEH